ncbi:Ankyrin repeat-containing protein [Spatholobus suberectus]|nr:Ankyrin repeat-containing protein [Spatholobus suberectus]
MDTVNANPATSSPSQTQVDLMASAQFASPSVDLTTSSPQSHVVQIPSAQLRHPSRHKLEDKREYLDKCVPLYKLALRDDWNAARIMIDADSSLLNAAITKEWGTLLHVVAGTDHVHFVNQLLKLLNPDDLELQDFNGNTAFCYTAASGNLQIAAMMIKKNSGLPKIKGAEGATPLYMAALQGKGDLARHLYALTTDILEEDDWNFLFFRCIKNEFYDIALQMVQEHSMLAFARDENNETGLHLLARKPSGFSCRGYWYLQNKIINSSMKPTPFVHLVECLWSKLLDHCYDETEMREFISLPSQITFDATVVGNFHFVATLMRSYPDLLWEVDAKNRSIIHMAVLHRHSTIFSLINELGSFKDFIATFVDDEGNNILHYAAKLTPPIKLSLISGEALQMTHELLWFEEVKKIMLLLDIEKKNSEDNTPREIFVEEHKELLAKAESWTKSTANNCMLVSTLIITGVFTATFMIPGGNNKNSGTPNYLQKPAFLVFAVSVACALISSSASALMFLSILISSYAEDGRFKSLPFKLLFGMVAQIISITSMMIAFSVAFYITYSHGLTWVPKFVSVLSFLPIPLFTCLLFPLWSDIIQSSYFCMSLFRPRK